jgi:hypothetical protein
MRITSGRPPFVDENHYILITKIPKGLREMPIPNTPEDYIKVYTGKYIKSLVMIYNNNNR